MPLKDDVAQLKAELAQLQSLHLSQQSSLGRQLAEFSTKLETLSQQIATEDAAETTLNMAANASSIASVLTAADNAPTLTYAAQTPTLEPASVEPAPAEPNPWQQGPIPAESWQEDPWQRKTKNTPTEQATKTEHLSQAQNQQLSDEVKLQASVQAASQFDELLSQGLAAVMAPFTAVNEQVKSFYHHYQAKGLGPVFLMTVAGIITLTLGFGYLLQYSINHWFSELGKALLGFASANAIIVGGIFIRQKRAGMADFGSGIVGLGLILNYLCAYFIGQYFELIPNSASFILLLLITLAGYGLSMRLDAKVIAVIALVGGSTAPMMLLSQSYAPLLYLPYLLLIGAGALAQSRKLKWPLLLEITALLHIGCIEAFSHFIELPLRDFGGVSLLALISINAFFYLYGITGLLFTKPFTHHDEKHNALSHRILALPIALLAFVLLELTQFTEFAGEIFAANALICAALYWKRTGSFSFSAQPLMAKLARFELFIALLLAHYWYRRHYKDALFAKAAYTMQIFCYLLLPLILLPKVIRNHWEYTAIALWLSTFMSLGLAYFVKHKSLNIEAKILTWLAVMMTASLCLINAWQGLAALTVGALFMGFTLLRYRQLPETWRPLLQLQWQLSPYYFALVLAVIVYDFNHSELVGIAMTALALSGYFALLIQKSLSKSAEGQTSRSMKLTLVAEIQAAIKESYHLAYGLTLGLALLPIMLHFEITLGLNRDNASFVLIEFLSLTLLARLILQHGAAIRLHRRILPLQGLKWGWHLLLALSYFMWSYSFDSMIAAPLSAILLVIHGSVLMFISLKPQNADMIRLAAGLFILSTLKVLLLDMASFELVQKVIAFMLIGVILLTVSYFYQKARNRLQQD